MEYETFPIPYDNIDGIQSRARRSNNQAADDKGAQLNPSRNMQSDGTVGFKGKGCWPICRASPTTEDDSVKKSVPQSYAGSCVNVTNCRNTHLSWAKRWSWILRSSKVRLLHSRPLCPIRCASPSCPSVVTFTHNTRVKPRHASPQSSLFARLYVLPAVTHVFIFT